MPHSSDEMDNAEILVVYMDTAKKFVHACKASLPESDAAFVERMYESALKHGRAEMLVVMRKP